ncbi:MAG: diaminopimelate epimerase [Gemmatimonadota bacterium]
MSEGEGGNALPLLAGRDFFKAHGLGNDYLVFERAGARAVGWPITAETVRRVCHRQEGVGGDGMVVLLDRAPGDGVFPLRMFNPDGSEFERSGNGLRVLAAALFRSGLAGAESFRVRSGGDEIPMIVHGRDARGHYDVSVDMGRARVGADAGVVAGQLDGEGRVVHPTHGPLAFVPISVGNPHAVVFPEVPSEALLRTLGPFIATHPAFPDGTNVQLASVVAPGRLRILIWERGVGETSASGTSSCAAAAAAVLTGRLEPGTIEVEMRGGALQVQVGPDLNLVLRGPVTEVAEGTLTEGFCEALDS